MAKPRIRDLPDLSDLARPGRLIAVRVTPKAARDAIRRDGDILRVSVTAVPEDGKANRAVQTILARAMGVAGTHLELRRGHGGRDKVFAYVPPGGGVSRS